MIEIDESRSNSIQNPIHRTEQLDASSEDKLSPDGDANADNASIDFEINKSNAEAPRNNSKSLTIFLILNTMIGSGILNQPQVFKEAGIFGALILFAVSSFFVWLGLTVLVESGASHNVFDYAGLATHVLGFKGRMLVNWSILVYTFGALLSYITIVGGTSSLLVQSWGCSLCNMYAFTVLMVAVIVLPLCLYKYYGHLGAVSVLSVIAIDSVLLLVVIGGPLLAVTGPINLIHSRGAIMKMGSVVFAMSCAPATFHAYCAMKEADMSSWRYVTSVSVGVAATMCIAMGLGGYLSFKQTTSGEILENFTGRYADLFKVMLVLHLCLYIPIDFVVMRHSVIQLCGVDGGTVPTVAHVAVTSALLAVTTGIVLLLRFGGLAQGAAFGLILDLTGSVAGSLTSFVIPAAIFLTHASKSHAYYWPSVLMLLFGVFTALAVPITTIIGFSRD